MDVTSISAAYASLKAVKALGAAALDAKSSAEAKSKITEVVARASEIQEALFWVREELLKQQEENKRLREQVDELEKSRITEDSMRWERPYYFLEVDGRKDGPFCQNCWDSARQLIRLQEQDRGSWYCQHCKAGVIDSNYETPRAFGDYDPYI